MLDQDSAASFDAPGTYDTAAADYEEASRHYWAFAGERTVARLHLRPGDWVLDAAAGTGSSAIAAAEVVGAQGRVVAADLADQMLAFARARAEQKSLQNIEFCVCDMTRLGYPNASFDAVICVLGLFFVPDMAAQVAELWRMVKPGGALAVTTIGPGMFAPILGAFRDAVHQFIPEMALYLPWERTQDADVVQAIMAAGGARQAEVTLELNTMPLAAPATWWKLVLGTGLRRYVEEMGPELAAQVRAHNLAWIERRGVSSVEFNVIYAQARK